MPRLVRLRRCCLYLVPVLGVFVSAHPARAQSQHYVDERTGVDAWRWEGEGVRIQLIQRLPDQTRAFFLGRGFDRAAADRIASECVLQTIFTNTRSAGPAVHIHLADWRYDAGQGPEPLHRKDAWQREWVARRVAKGSRIAFQWALFPDDQIFHAGDWNMGMTTYPVPPGTRLIVHARWSRGGEEFEAIFNDVRCAGDGERAGPEPTRP